MITIMQYASPNELKQEAWKKNNFHHKLENTLKNANSVPW